MSSFLASTKEEDVSVMPKVRAGTELVRNGHSRLLVAALRERLSSAERSFGLRRDLEAPFEAPDARFAIAIRPLRRDDVDVVLGLSDQPSDLDVMEVTRRRQMVETRFPNCWVAVTEDDQPCYVQWLFGAEHNNAVREHFGDLFPVLTHDTALLEGAYTPAEFRGNRVMPAAMARIAEQAAFLGARYVITFVGEDNIPSLKGCERAGFKPYAVRWTRYHMLRRSSTFEALVDPHDYPL